MNHSILICCSTSLLPQKLFTPAATNENLCVDITNKNKNKGEHSVTYTRATTSVVRCFLTLTIESLTFLLITVFRTFRHFSRVCVDDPGIDLLLSLIVLFLYMFFSVLFVVLYFSFHFLETFQCLPLCFIS